MNLVSGFRLPSNGFMFASEWLSLSLSAHGFASLHSRSTPKYADPPFASSDSNPQNLKFLNLSFVLCTLLRSAVGNHSEEER